MNTTVDFFEINVSLVKDQDVMQYGGGGVPTCASGGSPSMHELPFTPTQGDTTEMQVDKPVPTQNVVHNEVGLI